MNKKNLSIVVGIVAVIVLVALGWIAFGTGKPALPFPLSPTSTSTTAVLPTSTPQTQTTSDEQPQASSGGASSASPVSHATPLPKNTVLVTYTDSGFSPSVAEIRLGEVVRFDNQSSRALWVQNISGSDPAHNSQFNEGASVRPGQYWDFAFTVQGTWGYENLDYPTDRGAVAVEPENFPLR